MIAFNSFNGAECVALYNAGLPYQYLTDQGFFSGPLSDFGADLAKGANPPDASNLGTPRPEVTATIDTAHAGYWAWYDANHAKKKGKHQPSGG